MSNSTNRQPNVVREEPVRFASGKVNLAGTLVLQDGRGAAIGWVNQSQAAMRHYSSTGTYIDYLSSSVVADVGASYGDNYDRLSALKRMTLRISST